MTSPGGRLAELMAPDPASRRALAETLLDSRAEAEAATTGSQRLRVALGSFAAVARVLASAALSETRALPLTRLALRMTLLVILPALPWLWWSLAENLAKWPTAYRPELFASLLPASLLPVLPLGGFFVAAVRIGRTRPPQILGTAAVMSGLAAVVAWLVPHSNGHYGDVAGWLSRLGTSLALPRPIILVDAAPGAILAAVGRLLVSPPTPVHAIALMFVPLTVAAVLVAGVADRLRRGRRLALISSALPGYLVVLMIGQLAARALRPFGVSQLSAAILALGGSVSILVVIGVWLLRWVEPRSSFEAARGGSAW